MPHLRFVFMLGASEAPAAAVGEAGKKLIPLHEAWSQYKKSPL
jgi:hypothetical protein